MKNFERYKTAEERHEAFSEFCDSYQFCTECPLDGHDRDNCNRFKWLDLEADEVKPLPCPFCNNEYVEVGKGVTGTRKVECVCGYSSQAKESESEAIAAHNRVCKAVAAMNCDIKVGDTIAYLTLEDNGPEWKSFTVRLIDGGMLYEYEDKSGDNIAIACAHKVIVREGEVNHV